MGGKEQLYRRILTNTNKTSEGNTKSSLGNIAIIIIVGKIN